MGLPLSTARRKNYGMESATVVVASATMALTRGEIRDSNETNLICPFDAAAPNSIVERWLMMGDQNCAIKQCGQAMFH